MEVIQAMDAALFNDLTRRHCKTKPAGKNLRGKWLVLYLYNSRSFSFSTWILFKVNNGKLSEFFL